jgi:hypothetical protein
MRILRRRTPIIYIMARAIYARLVCIPIPFVGMTAPRFPFEKSYSSLIVFHLITCCAARRYQPYLVAALAAPCSRYSRAVPGVPGRVVRVLDVQIDGDLADVVQQRGVGRARSPGFGLGRLRFRRGSGG